MLRLGRLLFGRTQYIASLCTGASPPPTPRESSVSQMTQAVFSQGSQLLKLAPEIWMLPEGTHSFPEVAFIGAVSSGKSSVVRALMHSKNRATIGAREGGTKALTFWNVGDCLLLVDTPGFGRWMTRAKKTAQRKFTSLQAQASVRQYIALRKHANLKRVYWVMDATKIGNTVVDPNIAQFLLGEQIPFTVVLNKIDLLGQSRGVRTTSVIPVLHEAFRQVRDRVQF